MDRTVLHIDSSARLTGSTTRDLSARIVARLGAGRIIRRDLARPLPQIDEAWVTANFTPAGNRTAEQRERLAQSDALVREVMEADTLVIGAPIYNFSVPTGLRAWIDLVARAGLTFQYTEAGPKGLLEGKRAIIAVASGGTKVGSEIDFATTYLTHVLGFIGITDVEIIAADQMALNPDLALSDASAAIERIAA
jgi:FMN-dependent NADH-azoreductase